MMETTELFKKFMTELYSFMIAVKIAKILVKKILMTTKVTGKKWKKKLIDIIISVVQTHLNYLILM